MAPKHEYDVLTRNDRGELLRAIEDAENGGWELITITESFAWWGEGTTPPKDATHTFTAWLRQPREEKRSGKAMFTG